MAKVRKSHPRFRRVGEPATVRLTDDDLAVLEHIERHRFLRTTDVYRLFPTRAPDRISRRLMQLYRAGYLDRPLSQINQYRSGGSQPLVYGLDGAGARLLALRRGETVRSNDIRARNRRYARENLEHTLAVAQYMVGLELAYGTMEEFTFVRCEEMLARAPDTTRRLPQPGRWSVTVPWHRAEAEVMIAPDAIYGLRQISEDGGARSSYYFVEVDRGSMTITPSDAVRRSPAFLYRSSLLRKLFAYGVSHRDGIHQRHFGIPSARVVMLTTSEARAQEVQTVADAMVVKPLGIPSEFFRFDALPDLAGLQDEAHLALHDG